MLINDQIVERVDTFKFLKEFKYVWVLYKSDGKMECETERRIGAVLAVMQMLYWTLVVKRKLSIASRSTFRLISELWVVTERIRLRKQAAEISLSRLSLKKKLSGKLN